MIGQRLHGIEVEQDGGARIRLDRHPRNATVLLLPHPDCPDCDALRRSVTERAPALERRWAARVVTAERDERLERVLDLASDDAAVVVLDRFGTVWERHRAGPDSHDRLPDAPALEEVAKFLGTQCPECGVPDWPSTGEWCIG